MLITFAVYQSVSGVVTSQRWGLKGGNRGDSYNNDLVEYNESISCFALRSHDGLMQVGHDMNDDYLSWRVGQDALGFASCGWRTGMIRRQQKKCGLKGGRCH